VIAASASDNLVFYWQTIGTPTWNAEQVAGPKSIFGGPSVAQVGDTAVIAASTGDGSLMFYWQTIGTPNWNVEQVAGPQTTSNWGPCVARVG